MSDAILTFELTMAVFAHPEGLSKEQALKERVQLRDPKVIHDFVYTVKHLNIPSLKATFIEKKRLFSDDNSKHETSSFKSSPPSWTKRSRSCAMHAVDRVMEEQISVICDVANSYRTPRGSIGSCATSDTSKDTSDDVSSVFDNLKYSPTSPSDSVGCSPAYTPKPQCTYRYPCTVPVETKSI